MYSLNDCSNYLGIIEYILGKVYYLVGCQGSFDEIFNILTPEVIVLPLIVQCGKFVIKLCGYCDH